MANSLREELDRDPVRALCHDARSLVQVVISLQNALNFDEAFIRKSVDRVMTQVERTERLKRDDPGPRARTLKQPEDA